MLEVIEQLEDRIGKLISEVEALRDLRMTLQDQNNTLRLSQADHDSVVSQLQQKSEELSRFAQERNELEYLRAELQSKAEVQEKFDYAQLRIEELEQWHNNVCSHRDEVQNLFDAEVQKTQNLQQELATLRMDFQNVQNRVMELENNLQFANQEKDRVWSDSNMAQQELASLRQTLSQTEGVRDALFVERDNLLLQVQNKQIDLSNLLNLNTGVQQEISNLQGTKAQLEEELNNLRNLLAQANERDERMKTRLSQLIERIQLAESALHQNNGGIQSVQLEVFS